MAPSSGSRRGRPRDPDLDDTVLTATLELLGERGYQRLRVGDIAERARAGLGAVYRRWPGKREVVLAALERVVPDRDLGTTDDPAADIATGLRLVADAVTGPVGRILAGLLPQMADDQELASAIGSILSRIRGEQRERVIRLIGDAPDLNVRADLGPAYVLMHGLLLGRPVSDEEIRTLVAVIAAPLPSSLIGVSQADQPGIEHR